MKNAVATLAKQDPHLSRPRQRLRRRPHPGPLRRLGRDTLLPAGRKTTVNGQPAVLAIGLKGTMYIGLRIPEGAQEKTFGTTSAEPNRGFPKPFAYTDGKRLTWYIGDAKAEMLSNLSEADMLRIAESLVPTKKGEGKPPFQPSLDPSSSSDEGEIILKEGTIESRP